LRRAGPQYRLCLFPDKSAPMRTLLQFVDLAFAIYLGILLVNMAVYWLIGFGVLDADRPAVAAVRRWLLWVASPPLRLVQLIAPKFGAHDSAQLVALLIVAVVRYAIALYITPYVH
jgi:uncharacterized protein YggT (Ycf19 family)